MKTGQARGQTLRSPTAISSSRAARTSAAGNLDADAGPAGASRSTSRGLPCSDFLSRASARHARLPVDPDGLRGEDLLDRRRLLTGEPQGGEEPERDGLTVRQVEAGGRFEGVRERVPEVQLVARAAVVRILQSTPPP